MTRPSAGPTRWPSLACELQSPMIPMGRVGAGKNTLRALIVVSPTADRPRITVCNPFPPSFTFSNLTPSTSPSAAPRQLHIRQPPQFRHRHPHHPLHGLLQRWQQDPRVGHEAHEPPRTQTVTRPDSDFVRQPPRRAVVPHSLALVPDKDDAAFERVGRGAVGQAVRRRAGRREQQRRCRPEREAPRRVWRHETVRVCCIVPRHRIDNMGGTARRVE